MFKAQADSLVSVKDVTEHPAKIVTVDAEGNASFLRLEGAECVGVATPAGRNDPGETT